MDGLIRLKAPHKVARLRGRSLEEILGGAGGGEARAAAAPAETEA